MSKDKEIKNESAASDSIKIDEESKLKVYGSAVAFSFIIGFSFLGIKTCLAVADPLETLVYRYNFAFLGALIPIIAGFIKVNLAGRRKGKLIITAGFYISFMALQTIGLVFATSIESGIIFAMVPILVKIMAGFFLKEQTNWKQNVFIFLSVAAVITMFILGAADITVNFIGLVILFVSSLLSAFSNIMMRYVRGTYTPFEITLFITGGGFIAFNLAAIIIGLNNGTLVNYFEPLTHISFIIAAAYLGLLSTLISSILNAYMLAHLQAVKGTIFGNLSTAITIVAGVVVLGEPLGIYHIICTILIIIGVAGLSMASPD
ncbi:MAG: DMT family transporter [Eubacteriales bacterium]|nr:DMT family transporter [Eubacteriales bacterium]MDD4121784.1 DMT family transporter [Eubacteriales bacterium]